MHLKVLIIKTETQIKTINDLIEDDTNEHDKDKYETVIRFLKGFLNDLKLIEL